MRKLLYRIALKVRQEFLSYLPTSLACKIQHVWVYTRINSRWCRRCCCEQYAVTFETDWDTSKKVWHTRSPIA